MSDGGTVRKGVKRPIFKQPNREQLRKEHLAKLHVHMDDELKSRKARLQMAKSKKGTTSIWRNGHGVFRQGMHQAFQVGRKRCQGHDRQRRGESHKRVSKEGYISAIPPRAPSRQMYNQAAHLNKQAKRIFFTKISYRKRNSLLWSN